MGVVNRLGMRDGGYFGPVLNRAARVEEQVRTGRGVVGGCRLAVAVEIR